MKRRQHRRGLALMLVISVLALASALSYVMLSSSTLQNRAGSNQARLASAEYLAESGLNIALYYLQYPSRAPSLNASGYWGGTNGELTISSNIAGTVNITVTRDANDSWSYEIVCVATAGTNSGTKVTKTTGARVYVRNEFAVTQAAVFNRDTTVYPYFSVQGDVWSSKNLGIRAGTPSPTVTGAAYCKTAVTGVGWLTPAGGWKAVPNTYSPAPSGLSELNLYQTYTVNDISYSCDTIIASSMGAVTKNPTVTNPAGVIYKSGDLELTADTQINGTLVVQGNLRIRGANIVITAQSGYPALIVTGTLQIDQSKNSLLVNGICFVGTTIRSNGGTPGVAADISTFTVDGSLLLGSTGALNVTTPYNVTTVVKYSATKAKAPELSPVQRVAKGVSIVRWGLP